MDKDKTQELVLQEKKNELVKVPLPQTEFLQTLIDSKKLPVHVKTVADAFTIAQMGKELGFPTMQSFHYIIPIEGRLTLSAKAINAILRRGGVRMQTIEDGVYVWPDNSTTKYNTHPTLKGLPLDRRTTIRFIRDSITEDCEFTMRDARQQGLDTKSNWAKMPKEMLYARCLARGANRMGADLLLGLYMAEEIADTFRVDENLLVRNEEGMIEAINIPGNKPDETANTNIEITEDITHEELQHAA